MKSKMKLVTLVLAFGLVWAGMAQAQVTPLGPPNLPPAGFDVTGFIQEATLAKQGAGATAANFGGTITINGIKIIVPDNSVVQMPAAAFQWAELFSPAISHSVGYLPPRPNHRPGITGLALADNPLQGTRAVTAASGFPYPSYEARVVGNVVYDQATGTQKYIAGLIVPVTQQGLNSGAGIINFIDYAAGRFRVGGIIGDQNSGTLCEINDPILVNAAAPGIPAGGRFGKQHSPDPRFTADTNNPTISTSTGYPCGLPRVAPSVPFGQPIPIGEIGDPIRPYTQRPKNGQAGFVDPFLPTGSLSKTFTMPQSALEGQTVPDPFKQLPIMVGDYVTYSGTTFKLNPIGPNTAANTFVSVHTMEVDLGVYTFPGSTPVYVNCTVAGLGTDGVAGPVDPPILIGPAPGVALPGEFSNRSQFEGFCTDIGAAGGNKFGTASITISGVDVTAGGAENPIIIPANAGGLGNPANPEIVPQGRWRFRVSSLNNTVGNPIPLTREYRVVHSNGVTPNVCNGLTGGQFQLPIFDFFFPERTTFGSPQYPFNFQDMNFLMTGNIAGGAPLGQLDPWPGNLPTNQPN